MVAAYNAADTLATTLDSLRGQIRTDWEAIVVDDGSDDGTGEMAERFAERDARIRVLHGQRQGAAVARNVGIEQATMQWLHFLDADDWVVPSFLDQVTAAMPAAGHAVDLVYSGARRFTTDGRWVHDIYTPEPDELFPLFARFNAFTTGACVVRRALVLDVGGFDPALRTCQDWDLWQRVMRTTDRVAHIPSALAQYRLRQGSASMSGEQLLADGLRVIERGHAFDPRVPNPLPRYADGAPRSQLGRAKLDFACWCAGLTLGAGRQPAALLSRLGDLDVHAEDIDLRMVAQNIVHAATFTIPDPAATLAPAWNHLEARIRAFLLGLEERLGIEGFSGESFAAVERMVKGEKARREATAL
ncbi:MAG TPA: glycosyltransferase [Gemmatimonadaceae bacterium]|nr:glycosyltransferase [Gemmatimonadaceae bacterium]